MRPNRLNLSLSAVLLMGCGDDTSQSAPECTGYSDSSCTCENGTTGYRSCDASGHWLPNVCRGCSAYLSCLDQSACQGGVCSSLSVRPNDRVCIPTDTAGRCPRPGGMTSIATFQWTSISAGTCYLFCNAANDGQRCLANGDLVCRPIPSDSFLSRTAFTGVCIPP